MNALIKLFTKKDWRPVKTINHPYRVFNTITKDTVSDGHTLTYYLYENQFGDRKIDAVDSQHGDLNVNSLDKKEYVFRSSDYRETIKPWLDGAYDPEIPNYYSIEHKDMLDTLRGRKAK